MKNACGEANSQLTVYFSLLFPFLSNSQPKIQSLPVSSSQSQSKNKMSSLKQKQTEFQLHPLVQYDPEAVNGGIEVLKLEYFEAKTTKDPLPRNQEVPKEAFGKLTARSILVATSHAWFHQCHPDPEGVKLEIMRRDFFPRLRERFPHTEQKS